MDIRYVESFVTVVECGSVAEAARQLDLTAAAVAARIRALEDDLGTTLMERSGRVVKPTEQGRQLLIQAKNVLTEVKTFRTLAHEKSAVEAYRFGTFISALNTIVPPLLKLVYAQYPALRMFVEPGFSPDHCRSVVEGRLDGALVVEHQFAMPKGCEWVSLTEDPLVVVAPIAFANADPHELLRTQPFIRYDRRVWGGRLADRYLRDNDIQPNERIEIDGSMAIVALVSQGLGISLLPNWKAMWHLRGQMTRIALPGTPPVRRIGMIWQARGPKSEISKSILAAAKLITNSEVE
jgi:DNA-binding transcriptional LysR family regulator